MGTRHQWTAEERQQVITTYDGTDRSLVGLASRLKVTKLAVKSMVQRLGLSRTMPQRRWTEEEDAVLAEEMEEYCLTVVARHMKRSINSVAVRAKRLRISRRAHSGWYTQREVIEILGVDHNWINARVKTGALRAADHHRGGADEHKSGAVMHISEKDLRAFIIENARELTGRNVDLFLIVEIVGARAPR